MKEFLSRELFCVGRGEKVLHTQCLKCSWFAAGSEEAIGIAQRAHKCRMAVELEPEPQPAR